jgi:hypothetical protein
VPEAEALLDEVYDDLWTITRPVRDGSRSSEATMPEVLRFARSISKRARALSCLVAPASRPRQLRLELLDSSRATNSSFHRELRGLEPAVDGLKVDDGGVTAEIEEILAGAKIAGAAALFAG